MNCLIENKRLLKSVHNGLIILKLFSKEKPVWGITDISRKAELPKSTVSRLISDLVKEGYLEKLGGKYQLGLSPLYLTGIITSQMEILRESVKPLKTLLKKVKETSYISILEGAFVFYLIQMDEYLSYQLLSDNKSPASCTSSGKVLLAYESLDKASKIIMKEQLLMQLTIIRETGYCIDVNEDVVSIAAPIRDYTCNVIAAVSTKSPRQKIDDHKIQLIKEEIIKTAKEISFQLGYLETIRYSK